MRACLIALCLLLGACELHPKTAAGEKLLEGYVDKGLEVAIKRLCRTPPDVVLRNVVKHGEHILVSAYYMCPEWRMIMQKGARIVSRHQEFLMSLEGPLESEFPLASDSPATGSSGSGSP